jgi:hypothetical protein
MFRYLLLLLCILPLSAHAAGEAEVAKEVETEAETTQPDGSSHYGMGVMCPRAGTQVTFYTQNNQQDAAGTIEFKQPQGFVVKSGSMHSLEAAGGVVLDSYCDRKLPGLRIDSNRDGWLLVGRLWLAPNQEWEYISWTELLRKTTIWKPLVPVALYGGTMDEVAPDKPYLNSAAPLDKLEVYPIKMLDSYALVLVDETGSFEKGCAGRSVAPLGRLGWMKLFRDDGKPVAIPVHAKGCEVPATTPGDSSGGGQR